MICFFAACQREISADAVEVRRVDGAEVAFGRDCPAGTLAQGRDGDWPLVRIAHHRCWFAALKRERRIWAADRSARNESGADAEECRRGLGGDDRGADPAPGGVRPR